MCIRDSYCVLVRYCAIERVLANMNYGSRDLQYMPSRALLLKDHSSRIQSRTPIQYRADKSRRVVEYCDYARPVEKPNDIFIQYKHKERFRHEAPVAEFSVRDLKKNSLPVIDKLRSDIADYRPKLPQTQTKELGMSPYARMLLKGETHDCISQNNKASNLPKRQVRTNIVDNVDRTLHCFRYNPSFKPEAHLKFMTKLNKYKATAVEFKHSEAFKLYKDSAIRFLSNQVKERITNKESQKAKGKDELLIPDLSRAKDANKKVETIEPRYEKTLVLKNSKDKPNEESKHVVQENDYTVKLKGGYNDFGEISYCDIEVQTLAQKETGTQYEIQRQAAEMYLHKDSNNEVDISQSLDNISAFIAPNT
eukprot:TRINITY_DN15102_c0_g1_i2.p1 TRINITY_DN15102_c0_g1~~TRINITY_DN15102_c0_g1_i2.p1  ORF type:complete len:365 (-),score=46.94 TRINITY_DN15102_c0_g1_i2:98-1192(-)